MLMKEYKEKKMQDPEFEKAYEKIQPEMNAIKMKIDAEVKNNSDQMCDWVVEGNNNDD